MESLGRNSLSFASAATRLSFTGNVQETAELLADDNNMEFSGLDIVRFGKDINQILHRETICKRSLLSQYDRAIEIFEQYYQYEEMGKKIHCHNW
ncbi:MAG: hypothetical protein WBJ13_15360 [Sedimentibacter sp.]